MTDTRYLAEHTIDRALPVEDVQHRIADRLGVDASKVKVTDVQAVSWLDTRHQDGRLLGYRTEWIFTAEITP